jgi:hemoglobin-like flavoprotein
MSLDRYPHRPRYARKPRNLDAWAKAYQDGDKAAQAREAAIYAEQLREEGSTW